MFEKTIAFVIERSKGPCVCEYNMGSCNIGTWDPMTGVKTPGHYDRGPCTRKCERCLARAVLDADGVVYEKDDRRQWEPWMVNMKIDCAAAPMMLDTIVTGTVNLAFNPYALEGVSVK
jgi:hypothetical protein